LQFCCLHLIVYLHLLLLVPHGVCLVFHLVCGLIASWLVLETQSFW
jgi:hypothetical protein